MARRRGLAKYTVAKMMPTTAPASQEMVRKGVIFGTPEDRKNIGIMAAVGFLLVGVTYYVVGRSEPELSIGGLLFTALHGGLLGMMLGQLILVYPDRVMVIFTLLAAFLGEFAYVTAAMENFVFTAQVFRDMTAVFFWAGFVGFWVGFIAYARRMKKREHFQQRFETLPGESEVPPEA